MATLVHGLGSGRLPKFKLMEKKIQNIKETDSFAFSHLLLNWCKVIPRIIMLRVSLVTGRRKTVIFRSFFHDREDSPWLRGYFHLDKKSMLTVVKRKGDKVLKYTAEDGNEYTYFFEEVVII